MSLLAIIKSFAAAWPFLKDIFLDPNVPRADRHKRIILFFAAVGFILLTTGGWAKVAAMVPFTRDESAPLVCENDQWVEYLEKTLIDKNDLIVELRVERRTVEERLQSLVKDNLELEEYVEQLEEEADMAITPGESVYDRLDELR